MESDEIHPTLQPFQHPGQSGRVAQIVVPAAEHSIFEADTPLAIEIVVLDELDHVADIIGLLHGHHLKTLLRERIMQADCQMTATLLEIEAQRRYQANRTESHPLRAPAETPVRGKDAYGLRNILVVVQWLAHTHKYGIRKGEGLVDTEELA